jgi:hypothetical protein
MIGYNLLIMSTSLHYQLIKSQIYASTNYRDEIQHCAKCLKLRHKCLKIYTPYIFSSDLNILIKSRTNIISIFARIFFFFYNFFISITHHTYIAYMVYTYILKILLYKIYTQIFSHTNSSYHKIT